MKFFILPFLLLTTQSYAKEVRIISLAPNLTEIIYELELEKSLVGVSSFSDYPEEAKKIEQVGSYMQPQIEKILRLNPTHVLVMKEGSPNIKQQLENAKVNFLIFESAKLNDYVKTVETLGNTFDKKKEAEKLATKWKNSLLNFSMFKGRPSKKTVIQVDNNPILVAGSQTFLSEGFALCSLKNVFTTPGYSKVSMETLMNRRPDVIFTIGAFTKDGGLGKLNAVYQKNPVLKSAQVVEGDGDQLSRLTSRFSIELFRVCSSMNWNL